MTYHQAEGLCNFLMTSATQKARKQRLTVLGSMSYSGGKGSSLVFCLGGEKFSRYVLDYPQQLLRDRSGNKEQLGLTLGGTMFLPKGSVLSLTECLWGRWDVDHYRGGNDCYRPQGKLGSVVFPQEIIAIISLEDREKQTQRQQKVGEAGVGRASKLGWGFPQVTQGTGGGEGVGVGSCERK